MPGTAALRLTLLGLTMLSLVASGCASGAPPNAGTPPVDTDHLARPLVERYPMAPLDGRQLPFSEAVRVGDLLLLSGQLGNRPGTLQLVPGGIAAQTRQTLDNVAAILARRGASLADVVKCTVMLADMAEWPAMNEVYVSYFPPDALPARSALGVNGLALGARVEIECVAVLPR
jgi:reactive intermediate/imine deaminase